MPAQRRKSERNFTRFSNLAAVFAGADFRCDSGTVTVLALGTSITLPSSNPILARLRATTSSGLISGQVQVQDTKGVVRRVLYKGILVPALLKGGGYYLVRDNTFSGYNLGRSRLVEIE